ncbi:type II secretion system ATP-binding protein [Salmonella enterica subsp. enterica]|uniref:Type II secretion system ATP-binding protein n=1 Tax=Salmonella enterica I TaxID=59201 RepID=A0A379UUZ5_SALET|nr:type II secretion system ATP-binding protein [Salmonella enterica subsp. enterica]
MNMEEIVTLRLKHNVSDLHLCNAWPARWCKQGRMENAPLPRLMSTGFCLIGLMMRNNISGERTASLIRRLAVWHAAPARQCVHTSTGNVAGATAIARALS